MKALFNSEYASISFNAEVKTLELIWKKPTTHGVYQEVFRKSLELLKTHKATSFISDIRNEGIIGPQGSKWLQEEIIPDAVKHGLKKIAIIMNTDVFKKFYINNITNTASNQQIQMNYFDSMADAYAWLK